MSARPKLPSLAEVIALAEQADLDVPVVDLARMHKQGVFSEQVVSVLWPKVTARQAAFLAGKSQYMGAPCKVHGTVERYVSNRDCVLCRCNKVKAYRVKNADAIKAARKTYLAENREYFAAYARAHYAANRERITARNRAHYASKKERAA